MATRCEKCNICKFHSWDLETQEGDERWIDYCTNKKHCSNGNLFEIRQHSTWTKVPIYQYEKKNQEEG